MVVKTRFVVDRSVRSVCEATRPDDTKYHEVSAIRDTQTIIAVRKNSSKL